MIVIVGLIIARPIGRGVAIGLTKMGTDKLCERIGVVNLMRTAGVEAAPSVAIAGLIKLFLILLIVLSAAETLGLETHFRSGRSDCALPAKMLGAIAVVMGGMFIGHHVQRGGAYHETLRGGLRQRRSPQVVYGIVLLITASWPSISWIFPPVCLICFCYCAFYGWIGGGHFLRIGCQRCRIAIDQRVYLPSRFSPVNGSFTREREGVVLAVGSVNTLIQVGNKSRIPNAELIQSRFSTRNDIEDE